MGIETTQTFFTWVFHIWLILLVILNIIPNYTPESFQMKDEIPLRTDYIQHFAVFFVLPVFYFLSGRRSPINRFLKNSWTLILTGILFAAFTETLQLFVPGRTFNPHDIIWNTAGFLFGISIVWSGSKIFRFSG